MSPQPACPFMPDDEYERIRLGTREAYDALPQDVRDRYHQADAWHFQQRQGGGMDRGGDPLAGMTVGNQSAEDALKGLGHSSSN